MNQHIEELEDPPFMIGDRVRIKEDGMGGEAHRIVGAQYDPRPVPAHGWSFWLIEETEIYNGSGGYDGFTPDQIEDFI